MDRGTKRKATAPPTPASETRAPKRQRSPQDAYYVPRTRETRESTTEVGTRFINQMKAARDKNGRLISTNFLTLPDKKRFPQYYEQILLPIAIETLEAKIASTEYTQLAQIESDVKRMVSNAKSFNETSSEIYQDAERIRKMTSNFMVKHNPAYENKDYVAFPTPLPDQPKEQNTVVATSPQAVLKVSKRSASPAAPKKAETPVVESEGSFRGKSFQDAQDQILNELINLKDDDSEFETFAPFINLPSRSITSYYEVIKQPLSLKGLLKKVHGVHGRHEATGVTDFKTWDAFESEMSRIWENARIYNEDGSDIYNLSIELETYFKERLAKAKTDVDGPTLPTLKLNLAAKPNPIKLRLGSNKASPAPQVRPRSGTPVTTGVSVDHVALQRQKDLVDAGMTGTKPSQTPQAAQALKPLPTPATQSPLVRTISGNARSSPLATNSIKHEGRNSQTPVIGAQRSPSAVPGAAIVPPQLIHSSSSSMLPPQSVAPLTNGMLHPPAPIQTHVPYHAPLTGLDSKWRPEGRDVSTALLQALKITTHPDLSLTHPLSVTLPAHPSLSHQSITLNLPPIHSTLRLEPHLLPSLSNSASTLSTMGGRPYKLFVTANGQRLQNNFLVNMSQTGRLQYDVKLGPGMNRIEIECVSAAVAGGKAGVRGGELELERIGVFVHLLRGW